MNFDGQLHTFKALMTKKPQQISSFEPDKEIEGYYLVTEKTIRKTRAGDSYIDLTLQDKTGKISAKIWKDVEEQKDEFSEGDAVAVTGHTDTYRNKLQLNVTKISSVREEHEEYGYSSDSLVPSSKLSPDRMWDESMDLIGSIADKHLKELLITIYNDNKVRLMNHPAAKFIHHNFRSGLLEHTLSLAKDAVYFSEKDKDIDRDLLLAGVFLHDIGKLKELTGEVATAYTDKGNLIGHIVLGRDMMHEAAKNIEGFPEETLMLLDHLILSHQGKYEFASPRRPLTKEAMVLHFLDEMDAKLNIFDKAVEEDRNEGKWTSSNNYFGAQLYKGSREDEKDA
ncbi:MAG: HD domain-containing protein [Candidatus Marinimicrobia bacterium]|nr:HD domain-containing protein [Candidatus Neomarinimicrobiota bacterium]